MEGLWILGGALSASEGLGRGCRLWRPRAVQPSGVGRRPCIAQQPSSSSRQDPSERTNPRHDARRQVYGTEELQHPYSYVLFLGADARGDLLPCRQLRDKYSQARRDVYRPGEDGGEGGEGGGGDDAGGGGGGGGGKGPGGPKIPGIDMSSLM